MMSDPADWIVQVTRPPRADVQLLCLPHAGGGISSFRDWPGHLPARIGLSLVQLPGRESRLREAPIRDGAVLVERLARSLLPQLDRPFALYGHSLGALLAFELARHLRARAWPRPRHLFVSGFRAPHLPRRELALALLRDDHLAWAVQRHYNGIPAAVASDGTLMKLLLPALRADLALEEGYSYRDEPPLSCPISAFGGIDDRSLGRADLQSWKTHTQGRFRLRMLAGGHFFPPASQKALLDAVVDDLTKAA